MRALAVVGIVLLALLVAAAAFAPASLVDARVDAATGGRVRIAALEGTLWRGRGVAVVHDGAARLPVAWKIDPWALARGQARIAFDPPAGAADAPRGSLALSAGGAQVEHFAVAIPAAAFSAQLPVPALHVGGILDLRADDVAFDRSVERGAVNLEWRGARLAFEGQPPVDLGTITVALSARDGALIGSVTSRGGAIRIAGEATLAPGRAHLAARLAPEPAASAAERAARSRLGTPAADGSVSINLGRVLAR
jgi:hypothetical protein